MIYILLGKINQMKKTILACALLFFVTSIVIGQNKFNGTQLVLLGTGTPFANPDRSGPALAIVVNNVSYVVDKTFKVQKGYKGAVVNGNDLDVF